MTIERPPQEVFAFVRDPKNLQKWASGLAGAVKVRFVDANPYGVLDHFVSVNAGPEIYMPMRVVPNAEGSEVLITLFRQPGVADEKFAQDTLWVRRDLETLKQLLEK